MGGNSWNRLEAEAGLTEYHSLLKLAGFFGEEGGTIHDKIGVGTQWESGAGSSSGDYRRGSNI